MNPKQLWSRRRPHLWFQLYWVVYLIWFFWLDLTITDPKYIIHSPVDDLIPFNEWFIFPYCSWFVLLAAVTALLWWFDTASYDKLCLMMFSGMTLCLIIYMVLPNGLDIRPTAEAIGRASLVGQQVHLLSPLVPSTYLLVSLAVAAGTDYAIFLVGRYQEARASGADPMAIRLGLLAHHYRADWEWTADSLREAQQRLARCLHEARQTGALLPEANCEQLAAFFWIGWEGAVLRAKLQRCAAPLQVYADGFFQLLR